MSSLETFLWGLGGALIGYVAVNVLPSLTAKAQGKSVDINWFWLAIAGIIYFLAGGFIAAAMGDATMPKHAVFYGMGWNAIVKGGGEGVKLIGKAVKK